MSLSAWTAQHIPDQTGKIAVITGANSGLGYESALALAAKGAHVVMACRNPQRAQQAQEALLQQVPNASVELAALDLGNLASVRAFAEAFGQRHSRLDILINNAGLMAIPKQFTADGFEAQFGVNHLGHYALTGLLMPRLLAAPGSRVVNVSSQAHTAGRIRFDNLKAEKSYSRFGAYAQSKVANLLFTHELQKRLDHAGAPVLSVAAHPGFAATSLFETGFGPLDALMKFGAGVIGQSAADGALPQLYAATAPDVQGGEYYGPNKGMKGYPTRVTPSAYAMDDGIAERLWDVSEQLTGVRYPLQVMA
jgi:NAD(P)-dependent dehydrogenase (short-subunit alcohol dehydrogenase family)